MSDSAPQNPMNSPFEALGPTVDFEVPLRYSDMDLFGHVNNARYFTFLEEARIDPAAFNMVIHYPNQ